MAKKKVKSSRSVPTLKKQKDNPIFADQKTPFILIGLGIIGALGTLIYSNSFVGAFHFDDLNNIVNNTKLRNLSDIGSIWHMSGRRFLAYFSFAVNYHYGELQVWGYHFVNLLIHLINTCLVWWLTALLFKTPVLKDHKLAIHSTILAFTTALLFLTHPLATQSVTYIVQRMASMVAMFYLLTMVFYLKARLAGEKKGLKYIRYAIALIFALMAMMTKENAFTIPLAIILIEICFLQTGKFTINVKDYRVLLGLGAIALTAGIVLMNFSLSIFKPIQPGIDHPYTITPLNYLITQFGVITKYIQLLILPINLNVDYDYPVVENFFEPVTIFGFLLLTGLFVMAIRLFNKHRIISFGIFWFFLTIAIESSIVPIADVIFEHRTYLPSLGFFLIVSTYVFYFFWEKQKPIAIAILTLIIGVNSFLTYQRNSVWENDVSLLEDVISKSPNKARPYVNMGAVYMDRGAWDQAAENFSKAIAKDPIYLDAYNNRGAAYTNLKKLDLAIADYSKAIEINPGYVEAYYNRAITYGNLGQWDLALQDFTSAITYSPRNAQLYFNRGNTHMQLKSYDQAVEDFTQSIALDPNIPSVYINRGFVYGQLNRWSEAINDYTAALAIQPNLLSALEKRALAKAGIGQWPEAIEDFSKMITLSPQNANYFYNRGYSYENIGQLESALADYDRALELQPGMAKAQGGREFVRNRLAGRSN